MRAVALMSWWKTKNALRTVFTDPRKFVPMILFFCCMLCSLGGLLLGSVSPTRPRGLGGVQPDQSLFEAALFLAILLITIGIVDTGLGDTMLAFGMSDVDYLFPSPISRRVVLAYRLPAITFGALISTLFFVWMYSTVTRVAEIEMPTNGHQAVPWYIGPGCVALCVAAYLNLTMFAVIHVENRKRLHRAVQTLFLGGIVALGAIAYTAGFQALVPIANLPLLRIAFFPCVLAEQGLAQQAFHVADTRPLLWLALTYAASLIPMFAVDANFYEQSIVSSEKIAAVKKAARAGFAAQQASRNERFKYKATRQYAVKPFGRGAMAIAWAHLCAAIKRPYANFVVPTLAGFGCGFLGAFIGSAEKSLGIPVVIAVAFYSSMGFMASARTASEAAVRRRDLLDPLPVGSWQAVAANLAAPWIAMLGFSLALGCAYALAHGPNTALLLFGILIFFPLRLGSRMVLQYILVLGYPDFSDKIQQLIAQSIYYVFALPFVVIEGISILPAVILQSVWFGLITVTLLQVGFFALLLWLAGIAATKSVSTGEPVNLWKILARA